MNTVLAVAAGGALGAVARHLTVLASARWFGPDFPWGTVVVNLVGSLLMGLLVGAFAHFSGASQTLRAFLAIGFLGSFTTFSTFSLDAVTLAERGAWWPALGYLAGSVGVGVLAFLIGLRLWRLAV